MHLIWCNFYLICIYNIKHMFLFILNGICCLCISLLLQSPSRGWQQRAWTDIKSFHQSVMEDLLSGSVLPSLQNESKDLPKCRKRKESVLFSFAVDLHQWDRRRNKIVGAFEPFHIIQKQEANWSRWKCVTVASSCPSVLVWGSSVQTHGLPSARLLDTCSPSCKHRRHTGLMFPERTAQSEMCVYSRAQQ